MLSHPSARLQEVPFWSVELAIALRRNDVTENWTPRETQTNKPITLQSLSEYFVFGWTILYFSLVLSEARLREISAKERRW